jgi:hypothetical protein
MRDLGYAPIDLARAIRDCASPGTGALTSDWYGESATFYYARRPLAIAVMDAATLDDRRRAPRWDVPGGDGRTYVMPSVTPSCFVLPRIHERQFPDLVARLRSVYRSPRRRPDVFDLR